jgi:nitroimidazol reductase NimA-like FMN-containing flavoprotein (pyridoxamine 5'-phosphate oxidase superfamily)
MSDQSNGKLSDLRIRELFESKNFAFLACLMSDGSPHVTPTWIDIENGNILVNTAIGRIKQWNISKDARVAFIN